MSVSCFVGRWGSVAGGAAAGVRDDSGSGTGSGTGSDTGATVTVDSRKASNTWVDSGVTADAEVVLTTGSGVLEQEIAESTKSQVNRLDPLRAEDR